jgi:hypothetical protein
MDKSKWPFEEQWPVEEQTWLTVRHRTPDGIVLVEAPCGCCYRAARHVGGVLQPGTGLLVLWVRSAGDLHVEDGRGRVHRLSDARVERHCDRHLREKLSGATNEAGGAGPAGRKREGRR